MTLNPVSSALLLLAVPLLTVPLSAHAAEHGQGWAAFGRQGFICVHGRSVPNACQDAITASVRLSTEQNRPRTQRQQPEVQASQQLDVPPSVKASTEVLNTDPTNWANRGAQGHHRDLDLQQGGSTIGVFSSPTVDRAGDPAAFQRTDRAQGPRR